MLERGAALYQDAELLVRGELREPRLYYSILRALSDGLTRISEITARVHGPGGGSDLSSYLHTLQQLGLAEYQTPVVGKSVRRGIWTVADPYLRFWFRFVLPYVPGADAHPDLALFGGAFAAELQTLAAVEGVRLVSPAELIG